MNIEPMSKKERMELELLIKELAESLNRLALAFALFATDCEAQAEYIRRYEI